MLKGGARRLQTGARLAIPDQGNWQEITNGKGDPMEQPSGPAEIATAAAAATSAAAEAAACGGQGVDAGAKAKEVANSILFHALREVRYHQSRARFLDRLRRGLDFVILLGIASVVSSALGDRWSPWLAVIVVLAGALQLVAGLAESAAHHHMLRRRFAELLGRAERLRNMETATAEDAAKLRKRWVAIWPDELINMHGLEWIAYNAAKRTLGDETNNYYQIPWNVYWFSQVWPFEGPPPPEGPDPMRRAPPKDPPAAAENG